MDGSWCLSIGEIKMSWMKRISMNVFQISDMLVQQAGFDHENAVKEANDILDHTNGDPNLVMEKIQRQIRLHDLDQRLTKRHLQGGQSEIPSRLMEDLGLKSLRDKPV